MVQYNCPNRVYPIRICEKCPVRVPKGFVKRPIITHHSNRTLFYKNLVDTSINTERSLLMNISYVQTNVDPPIYEFDGDFEKFLLNVGVPLDHINNMKNKILQNTELLELLCDPKEDDPKVMNVPVNKIIGVRRAEPNKSVFDNIIKFNRCDNFSNTKMIGCLDFANKMTYEDLKKSYSKLYDPVQLAYITEIDKYYLNGEHNHTTMCALIFDAPLIRAEVKSYSLNSQKVDNYKSMLQFFKEFNIAGIEKEDFSNKIRIVFKENSQLFCINYGRINENDTFHNIMLQLREMLTTDKKAVKIYGILRFGLLKKIWYKFFLSNRQREYIDKPPYNEDFEYSDFMIFKKI